MPIYFDESGYTGVNLMEANQPYFVYASINITDDEANNIVKDIFKTYRLQGNELKGRNLLKSNRGKKAIEGIFKICAPNAKAVIYDKKFALAGKFFEYVFEPVLADNNMFFYNCKFHLFVSNILYNFYSSKSKIPADELFRNFLQLLKGDNLNGLFDFVNLNSEHENAYWHQIAKFTYYNRKTILEEITASTGKVDTWVLELHGDALHGLLGMWSTEINGMEAICDTSLPLQEAIARNELFRSTGLENKSINVLGEDHPITYNLIKPITLEKSDKFPGIQIADVLASTLAYCLIDRKNSFSQTILPYADQYVISRRNVLPDEQFVNANSGSTLEFNAYILKKLSEYSEAGEPVLKSFKKDLGEKLMKIKG